MTVIQIADSMGFTRTRSDYPVTKTVTYIDSNKITYAFSSAREARKGLTKLVRLNPSVFPETYDMLFG